MFSELGQIFTMQPRLAEGTDTRQALQRHDPDQQRRRQNKREQGDNTLDDFSDTVVSVQALKIFLEKYIQGQNAQSTANTQHNHKRRASDIQNTPQTQPELDLGTKQNNMQSAHAARAAAIYQSTDQSQQRKDVLLETTDQGQGPEFDLSAADIRSVHIMMEKIDRLIAYKVEYLRIQRRETFIDSLMETIDQALPQN